MESLIPPNVRVKQEAPEETLREAATPTPAAEESTARVEVAVRIDAAILHCPLCFLPLKPPIFQCVAGHLACGVCHGKLTDVHCQACGEGDGGAYAHNPALDAIARSTKIRCPNDKYGCDRYVTYCDVTDHQRTCPHAPCTCPEPGCGYLAAPPALLDHLTGDHSWPSQEITYRAVHPLVVSASRRRLLLVVRGDGEGDGERRVDHRVCVVREGERGGGAAVHVQGVDAGAAGRGDGGQGHHHDGGQRAELLRPRRGRHGGRHGAVRAAEDATRRVHGDAPPRPHRQARRRRHQPIHHCIPDKEVNLSCSLDGSWRYIKSKTS